ncbi:hypothetical protein GCM10020255_065930 [Rhodococcus baikonurensis]
MIDEDTCQPVADCTLNQSRSDSGVDTTGQTTDGVSIADLLANLLDQRIGDVRRRPRCRDTGDLVQEATQDLLTVRRMQNLGVVLHTGELAGAILERRDGSAITGRGHLEAGRRFGDGVAVTHPHRLRRGKSVVQQPTGYRDVGTAVFTGAGLGNGAAEGACHGLESVADSENRDVVIEKCGIELGSTVCVDTRGPTREHNSQGVLGHDLLDGRGVRNHLRVDLGFANSPCDQLRVLRSEVDDKNWSLLLDICHRCSLIAAASASARAWTRPAPRPSEREVRHYTGRLSELRGDLALI